MHSSGLVEQHALEAGDKRRASAGQMGNKWGTSGGQVGEIKGKLTGNTKQRETGKQMGDWGKWGRQIGDKCETSAKQPAFELGVGD